MDLVVNPIACVFPAINPIELSVPMDQIMAPEPSVFITVWELLSSRPVLHPCLELSSVHRPVVVNIYTMPTRLVLYKVSFVSVFVSFC